MKILKLTAQNVKKLQAVEITPGPKGLVVIAGNNGAGKSSVLDSIMYALAGETSLPSKPVRRGEDKARIELDLGEYVVTRTITATGGGQLTVRNKDNQRLTSPQTILDGLYGKLTFDPLEFRNQKPDKRSETLRALVGLDFSAQEQEINQVFSERTAVNREIKTLEARVQAVPEHPDAPAEEIQAWSVVAEQQQAIAANNQNQEFRARASKAKADAVSAADMAGNWKGASERTAAEIARLQRQLDSEIARFKELTAEAETKLKTAQEFAADAAQLKDVDLQPFTQRLQELQLTNSRVRSNKEKASLRKQLRERTKVADSLTDKLETLEKSKRQAVQNAKFPVAGLSLSDTREVEFNGIPFDEVNTADQLRVSVAMGLAMNPKLKVLLVRQGNDLDDSNLKLIGQMADEASAQIWLERVSTEGDVSVIIEDGQVVTEAKAEQKELV